MEHITTANAVKFVLSAPDNVVATITAHHLLMNRSDIFRGGIRPAPLLPADPETRGAQAGVGQGRHLGQPQIFPGNRQRAPCAPQQGNRPVVVLASIRRMRASSFTPKRSMPPDVWTDLRDLPVFMVPISMVLREIARKSPLSEAPGRYPNKSLTALIPWFRCGAGPQSRGRSNRRRARKRDADYFFDWIGRPDQERLVSDLSCFLLRQFGALH